MTIYVGRARRSERIVSPARSRKVYPAVITS